MVRERLCAFMIDSTPYGLLQVTKTFRTDGPHEKEPASPHECGVPNIAATSVEPHAPAPPSAWKKSSSDTVMIKPGVSAWFVAAGFLFQHQIFAQGSVAARSPPIEN